MSGLRERVAAVIHAEMFEGRDDGEYDLTAYAIADKVIAAVVVNDDSAALRDAARELVRLGNQPGLDDDEWEQAFSALEDAL